MDMRLKILELEQLLITPAVRANAPMLEKLLADDFIEFGAVGKRWTKAEVINGLKSQAVVTRTISDFSLRMLAGDVALATYLCRHCNGDGVESLSLRSSVWKACREGWQMAFHQGTRACD